MGISHLINELLASYAGFFLIYGRYKLDNKKILDNVGDASTLCSQGVNAPFFKIFLTLLRSADLNLKQLYISFIENHAYIALSHTPQALRAAFYVTDLSVLFTRESSEIQWSEIDRVFTETRSERQNQLSEMSENSSHLEVALASEDPSYEVFVYHVVEAIRAGELLDETLSSVVFECLTTKNVELDYRQKIPLDWVELIDAIRESSAGVRWIYLK